MLATHALDSHDVTVGEPAVFMAHDEALRVFVAMARARQHLAREVERVGRSKRSEREKVQLVAVLRADLQAFEEFSAALGEAHGIGGH